MLNSKSEKSDGSWGFRWPSGTTNAVTFYGHIRDEHTPQIGLVAHVRVQVSEKRIAFRKAIPLALKQLPEKFYLISRADAVRGGSSLKEFNARRGIEYWLSRNIRVKRSQNAG